MKSAEVRIAHYNARTNAFAGTTGLSTILTSMLTQQKAHFAVRTADLTAKQVITNDIIGLAGVPTTSNIFYQAFTGEMYRASLATSGTALQNEAAMLIAKYVARGLTGAILENIRTNVFSVGPAITP